jgi:hypothetical protein
VAVMLDYDARLIRRKRLVTDQGEAVMVDLAACPCRASDRSSEWALDRYHQRSSQPVVPEE